MRKLILYFVRYSVLARGQGTWNIAKQGRAAYRKQLFNPGRLRVRRAMFERICLASFLRHEYGPETDVRLYVLTSDVLPADDLAALKAAVEGANGALPRFSAAVEYVASGDGPGGYESVKSAVTEITDREVLALGEDCRFATVRVDDDDALSANFTTRIGGHLAAVAPGYAVSLAYGVQGRVGYRRVEDRVLIKQPKHLFHPKCATGLAFLNRWTRADGFAVPVADHVFSLGGHMKIEERVPLIIETGGLAHFRGVTASNDSANEASHKFYPDLGDHEAVAQAFPALVPMIEGWAEDAPLLGGLASAEPRAKQIAAMREALSAHKRELRKLRRPSALLISP